MIKEYLGYIVLAVTWLLSGAGLFWNTQNKIESQKKEIDDLTGNFTQK